LLDEIGEQRIEEQFSQLAEHGLAALLAEGIDAKTIQTEFSLDLRYQGQSYYLNIPWTKIETAKQAFHHSHQGRYGHSLDLPVELVNVRVALRSQPEPLQLNKLSLKYDAEPYKHVPLYGVESDVPVYRRDELNHDQVIKGPALITEIVSTTFIATGWQSKVDNMGNLLLTNQQHQG
jgi:N-methylhydantoinase A